MTASCDALPERQTSGRQTPDRRTSNQHIPSWQVILVIVLSCLLQTGAIRSQDSDPAGIETLEIPTPSEAQAALNAETRRRIVSYSDEERAGVLRRMKEFAVLESFSCFPALDRPADLLCVFRAIGWQGEPFFMQPAMRWTADGWYALEKTLKPACPPPEIARPILRSLVGDDSLEVPPQQDVYRFGLFHPTDSGPPRLKCNYDIRYQGPEVRLAFYTRWENGRYEIDEDLEFY